MTKQFDNLLQFIQAFPDNETCKAQFEAIRWNGTPVCPHCGSEKYYKLKNGKNLQCSNKECKKQFNVFTKTIFENTKIPLRTWFIAIYIATNHKKGISSHQLARDLGITQKTAWFILGRVREMLKSDAPFMVASEPEIPKTLEIDESYFGPKAKNLHNKKRKELRAKGTGYINKTMVFGILEREGHVHTRIVPNVDGLTLKPIIRQIIAPGAVIITDAFGAYRGLNQDYTHEIVNHTTGEYVRDIFHTNSIEGFWSQMKRGIYGVYHHCSPRHLHRYCYEFEYRWNTRKQGEGQRFNNALAQTAGKRLTYNALIGAKS